MEQTLTITDRFINYFGSIKKYNVLKTRRDLLVRRLKTISTFLDCAEVDGDAVNGLLDLEYLAKWCTNAESDIVKISKLINIYEADMLDFETDELVRD